MLRIDEVVGGERIIYRRCPSCNRRTPQKEAVCEECGTDVVVGVAV
jgi:rRNA maturation endonuclease Nob1